MTFFVANVDISSSKVQKMSFCTQCGHKNEAGGRFCEECGHPLKSATPTLPATPQPAVAVAPEMATPAPAASRVTSTLSGKKLALLAGISVLVVAIMAGVAAFALRSESPSSAVFSELIEQSLLATPTAYKSRYCLDNTHYDGDSLFFNSANTGAQRWMAVLTKAGLYSEPETVIQTQGFFNTTFLKYEKTEAGKKATDGQQLCFAEGVTLKSVDSFTPATKVGETEVSRAIVTLQLKNPMPWIAEDETKQAGVNRPLEFQDEKVFLLKERKWVLASAADIRLAQAGIRSQERLQATSRKKTDTGFFSSLKSLFASHSNPLIGKWQSTMMGMDLPVFEFDADTMVSQSGKVKVRYEITDKEVTVYPLGGPEEGIVFQVIDADTMRVNLGAELQIKRVK